MSVNSPYSLSLPLHQLHGMLEDGDGRWRRKNRDDGRSREVLSRKKNAQYSANVFSRAV